MVEETVRPDDQTRFLKTRLKLHLKFDKLKIEINLEGLGAGTTPTILLLNDYSMITYNSKLGQFRSPG